MTGSCTLARNGHSLSSSKSVGCAVCIVDVSDVFFVFFVLDLYPSLLFCSTGGYGFPKESGRVRSLPLERRQEPGPGGDNWGKFKYGPRGTVAFAGAACGRGTRVLRGPFYTNEAVNLLKTRRFHFWNRADPVN